MARTQWTRLDREQAGKVLQQLSSRRDAVVFSKDVTEVSCRQLPFYTNYWLCRLINYATMPTFSMTYLSDGVEYIPLDGTANPIYTVNEKCPIQLTEMNIIPYLEFFFGNVQGSEGDVFLIKDPKKTPFMDGLNAVQQEGLMSSFKPLQVVTDSIQNFRVMGTLYYGGGLITATIIITPDGKMSFQDQHLLMSGILFPENPYDQAWQG